jgi:subtilisin family serine protease
METVARLESDNFILLGSEQTTEQALPAGFLDDEYAVSSPDGPIETQFDSTDGELIPDGEYQNFIFSTPIDISAQLFLTPTGNNANQADIDLELYADIDLNGLFETHELIGGSYNNAGESESIFLYLPGGPFAYLARAYGYSIPEEGADFILELITSPDTAAPASLELDTETEASGLSTYGTDSYYFTIDGENSIGTYIDLYNFGDSDLDLFLFAATDGLLGPQLKSSEQGAGEDELIFKYLAPGDYIAKVYGYSTDSDTASYTIYIDTKSFAENSDLPDDPFFSLQWHHLNDGQNGGIDFADIYSPEAWRITTGSEDVIIAVIDTGVAFGHEDLIANIWQNAAETPDDGIDNDNNGYIDDINGWDFYLDNNYPFLDFLDDEGTILNIEDHGTHVAGIIAGVGNNGIGIAGVSWNSKIMPLKVFGGNPDEGAAYSAIFDAIYYAVDNGADIINLSLGATELGTLADWQAANAEIYQQYLDAFAYATDNGVLSVIAAGNESVSSEEYISTPAVFSTLNDGVISVAALNNKQDLSSYSNYGHKVTIAAPGGDNFSPEQGIFSTLAYDNYDYMPGTSMAAPVVAGVAALMKSVNPDLTPAELKELLVTSADQLRWLEGITESGSSINAYNAVIAARDFSRAVTPEPGPDSGTNGGGSASAGGSSSSAPATPVATPPTTPTTQSPAALPADPSTPITPTPSQESPVLGIQPQSAITTVQLTTPLTIGSLQVTQAVVGTPQRDVITGSEQGEAIAGGGGKNVMTGAGGPDAFIFETPSEFGKRLSDKITDFNPEEGDKLVLSKDSFNDTTRIRFDTAVGKKGARQAANTSKNFIYDSSKGILYFNENGDRAGWGDGGEFVRLTGAPDLTKADLALL